MCSLIALAFLLRPSIASLVSDGEIESDANRSCRISRESRLKQPQRFRDQKRMPVTLLQRSLRGSRGTITASSGLHSHGTFTRRIAMLAKHAVIGLVVSGLMAGTALAQSSK